MSSFLELLGMDVRGVTKRIQGHAYLPWALAHAQAGRPPHEVVTFKQNGNDSPVRQMFGGGAVAVDMSLGDGSEDYQRIYLPVLDLRNKPKSYDEIDGRDVNDTTSRCVARAIAVVHGYGLSLYSLTNGDGGAYVDSLGVSPDTEDLGQVRELRDIKEIKKRNERTRQIEVVRTQEYLGWHACVAACRVTDPSFRWEVVECVSIDEATGEKRVLPAMRAAGKGWMVGVRLSWKGRVHTQWLPIMGVEMVQTNNGMKPMEHQPIANPDVFSWHSAVMRCLAKAVAIATGYGIASYAGEHAAPGGQDVHNPEDDGTLTSERPVATPAAPAAPVRGAEPVNGQQQQQQSAPADQQHQGAEGESEDPEGARLVIVAKIKKLIKETNSDSAAFEAWLGGSIKDAETSVLERGHDALVARKEKQKAARSQPQVH